MSDRRWPRWVYGNGEEPDYRFSFANERTFLAWIRTALALVAAGVAVDAFELDMPSWSQHAVATVLVVLGAVSAVAAWLRWASAERAIRLSRPLPGPWVTVLVAVGTLVVGVVVLVATF
ncbi:YidH family protein [Nocardioides caldifontis]|uniref:YidH family protein n=1 Tax=Nocardioides caldifontis TaxID=2588938 RepID=UPI0011DFEAFE|nr:DUF202 domain-containing protein [Nocardioides caldifontis]